MSVRHLTQSEVARRWCLSPCTLERWWWLGKGPPFLKIGGRVAYRLEDIEKFEATQICTISGATGDCRPAA
jgi:predicted site-specific integrase-resolvase